MHLPDDRLGKEELTGWSETDADTSLFTVMPPEEAWWKKTSGIGSLGLGAYKG